jgi:hypothetical protein
MKAIKNKEGFFLHTYVLCSLVQKATAFSFVPPITWGFVKKLEVFPGGNREDNSGCDHPAGTRRNFR